MPRYIKLGFNGKPIGKWHEVESSNDRTWCGVTTSVALDDREQNQDMYTEAICEPCRRAKAKAHVPPPPPPRKRKRSYDMNGGFHRGPYGKRGGSANS